MDVQKKCGTSTIESSLIGQTIMLCPKEGEVLLDGFVFRNPPDDEI
jgi:hypothetical protein